jgi:hypothetical protein
MLHPYGLILHQTYARQTQNIRAIFQKLIIPAISVLVADCCVFLLLFYRHLIAGGKAPLLLSSPVVTILSLPHPPPLPSSPLLANHELGQ